VFRELTDYKERRVFRAFRLRKERRDRKVFRAFRAFRAFKAPMVWLVTDMKLHLAHH